MVKSSEYKITIEKHLQKYNSKSATLNLLFLLIDCHYNIIAADHKSSCIHDE